MRRHAGDSQWTSPSSGSRLYATKISPKSRRPQGNGTVVFPRNAAIAFAVVALVILLGVHVFLLQAAVTMGSSRGPLLRISSNVSVDSMSHTKPFTVTPLRDVDLELYTIRINTWQRLEQLLVSIEHHSSCPGVAQIQVVWCEEVEPPQELLEHPKVVVERHTVNSLNERFHILEESPTLGILSMDDDVLRPCEAIDSGTMNSVNDCEALLAVSLTLSLVQCRFLQVDSESTSHGGL